MSGTSTFKPCKTRLFSCLTLALYLVSSFNHILSRLDQARLRPSSINRIPGTSGDFELAYWLTIGRDLRVATQPSFNSGSARPFARSQRPQIEPINSLSVFSDTLRSGMAPSNPPTPLGRHGSDSGSPAPTTAAPGTYTLEVCPSIFHILLIQLHIRRS